MKLNDALIAPDGRPAKLITLPIPGRKPARAVILFTDGRGRLVDLAECRPAETESNEENDGSNES